LIHITASNFVCGVWKYGGCHPTGEEGKTWKPSWWLEPATATTSEAITYTKMFPHALILDADGSQVLSLSSSDALHVEPSMNHPPSISDLILVLR